MQKLKKFNIIKGQNGLFTLIIDKKIKKNIITCYNEKERMLYEMETFVNGRNLSNDEKKIKLSETLNKALYLESIGKKNEAEKLFLKSCRIAENLYRQTFSNKDRIKVVECYIKISEFYQNSDLRMDFVQRWYQKIIGILQDSSKINSSMDEFRYLIEWYVKTIYLMFNNCDYNHIIISSKKMLEKSRYLYKKTKTNEDLKFIILSKLFLANAYYEQKKLVKAYYYYYLVVNHMEKVYQKLLDEGLKNDLLYVYQKLFNLTSKKVFRLINRKWKIRILELKETNNVK